MFMEPPARYLGIAQMLKIHGPPFPLLLISVDQLLFPGGLSQMAEPRTLGLWCLSLIWI